MSPYRLRQILIVIATLSVGLTASTALAQRYSYGIHGHGIHSTYRVSTSYYGGHFGHRHLGRGIAVSIGSYPYDYGFDYGYGYRGLTYRGFQGYPYPGYLSAYRGYSPYYASPAILGLGYDVAPAYVYVPRDPYRYGVTVAADDAVTGASMEALRRPVDADSPEIDADGPHDLRPGMVLPDGATVISVEPLGSE